MKLKILTVKNFADFRALIEKFPSWEEKVTSQAKPSRAELKMVQLEPWLEPDRLGLITNNYIRGQDEVGRWYWKCPQYLLVQIFPYFTKDIPS